MYGAPTPGVNLDLRVQSVCSARLAARVIIDLYPRLAAGPSQDMFLMPSATVEITRVKVVRLGVSGDKKTCTVSDSVDSAWNILMHLAGFYYISARRATY